MQQQPGAQNRPIINALQCGMLIAGFTSITNHALAVVYLLQAGGRDAWMGGLIGLPLAMMSVAALISLSRIFPRQSLVQYLPRLLGRGAGHILAVIYLLYFAAGIIFTLRRTTDWLVDSLLPETPPWMITGLYLVACLYIALAGIETLARTNQFTLPVLTFLGLLVSFLTGPAKDYRLMLPVLADGVGPVAAVSWTALGIFGELCIVGMFAQYVQVRPGVLQASLVGVLYAAVTMTGPVTGAIAALSYRQGANMPYATYQQWLMISFARFLERTDLLAVHQWLVGAYVRTGLLLFAVGLGIWQLAGMGTRSRLTVGAGLLAGLLAMLLFPNVVSFDEFAVALYLPAGALLGVVTPVLLWAVAKARGLRKEEAGGHGASG